MFHLSPFMQTMAGSCLGGWSIKTVKKKKKPVLFYIYTNTYHVVSFLPSLFQETIMKEFLYESRLCQDYKQVCFDKDASQNNSGQTYQSLGGNFLHDLSFFDVSQQVTKEPSTFTLHTPCPTGLPTQSFSYCNQESYNQLSPLLLQEILTPKRPWGSLESGEPQYEDLCIDEGFSSECDISTRSITNNDGWVNPVHTPIEPLSYNLTEYCDPSLSMTGSERTIDQGAFDSLKQKKQGSIHIVPEVNRNGIQLLSPVSPLVCEIKGMDEDLQDVEQIDRSKEKKAKKKPARIPKGKAKKSAVPGSAKQDEYVPVYEQLLGNEAIMQKISMIKKKGIYRCAHCTKNFSNLLELALHFDEHKIVRMHKCPFSGCPWSVLGLPKKAEVRRHCAAQHDFQIGVAGRENPQKVEYFSCNHENCDRVFKRRDSFKRHQRLVHLTATSRFNRRMEKLVQKKRKEEHAEMERYIDVSETLEEEEEKIPSTV